MIFQMQLAVHIYCIQAESPESACIQCINTANCMWNVIESSSPISISLVSLQQNVAKETYKRDLHKRPINTANCMWNVVASQSFISIFLGSFQWNVAVETNNKQCLYYNGLFCRSLLQHSIEKRPKRLRLEIEIQ